MKLKKVLKRISIPLICLVAFINVALVDDYFEISKNMEIYATLYKELNYYYVDEVDPNKLMREGIDAMLKSLDPYTNFISESEIEDYRFQTTGKYGGVGAIIRQNEDQVIISEPYEGFPAHKAGLRAGDIIVEVDGKNVEDKKTSEVSKLLKGQPGTQVELLIQRPVLNQKLTVKFTREEIKVENVPYVGMLDKDYGYFRLNSFTQKAGQNVKKALEKLKTENPNLKGVVFDLRGNPGGLLNEAINVSNIFIKKGVEVVSTRSKIKEWDKHYHTLNDPVDTSIPVVVLVNRGSASASEIVSGVIQDMDRGVVLGERTFGKGLVQTTRVLNYNTQLKVTTAKYYIPSGRCIQAIDYSEKNEDGSVSKIPDSLKTEFKTSKGRLVYDGGGIEPDVEVKIPTYGDITATLVINNYIFDYATQYRANHETIPNAKDFHLSDKEFERFVQYLKGKDYSYQTETEELLEDLEETAKEEKYLEAVQEDIEELKLKVKRDKEEDLFKYREEIKELLEQEIVTRYYYQKGRIEASFSRDEEIKKAMEILKDKDKYNQILVIQG